MQAGILANSQLSVVARPRSFVVYDIVKPDTGGNSDLTRIRSSVYICINVILSIIVNKRSFKWRSEEFVAGRLGRR